MPQLDRASFIEHLERLNAESEAEVLAAAREVIVQMRGAGLSWNDLLVRSPGESPESRAAEYDDPDDDISDFEVRDLHADAGFSEQEPIPPRQAAFYAAELQLIDSLLVRSSLSLETRRELLDLRADIASNDFAEMDRAYLRDLALRLDVRGRDD